jgi:hypothetical protein
MKAFTLCFVLLVSSCPLFPIDKHFALRVLATALMEGTDIALTQHVWNTRPAAFELDPVYGAKRPGFLRMGLIDAPFVIGLNLLSYKLKSSHPRLSWFPQGYCLAGSAWGISENVHTILVSPGQSWHIPPQNRPLWPPRP